MTKLHKTATALLFTAALLMTGCTEHKPAPAQGTDINTLSDVSGGNSSENSNSGNSESSSNKVNEGFTDGDRELQNILKDLQDGVSLIRIWFFSGAPTSADGFPLTQEETFYFPQSEFPDQAYRYYSIPDGYSAEGDTVMPTTRDGMMEMMLGYFSESYVHRHHYDIGTGAKAKNPDGTISVKFDEPRETLPGHFIEADGRLYRSSGEGGGATPTLICDTARLTFKTDDTIHFEFTGYDYGVESPDHAYRASGVLKYERGGWKVDQLKYNG